jgi:hypothetical protein
MLAEQLDLSLEDPGSHGDILPSNLGQVKWFCPRSGAEGGGGSGGPGGAGRCESARVSWVASRNHLDSQAFAFPGPCEPTEPVPPRAPRTG